MGHPRRSRGQRALRDGLRAVRRWRRGRGRGQRRRRWGASRSAPRGRTGRPGARAAAGRMPVASSTASGNLAGWAVARRHHRARRRTGAATRAAADADRGVRVEEHRRSRRARRRIVAEGRLVVDASPPRSDRSRGASTAPRPAEARHQLGAARAVAAQQLEQQPLEVGRHLDVHRRARASGTTSSVSIVAGGEEPGEDVVAVRRRRRAGRSAGPCAWPPSRRGRCRSCRSARAKLTGPPPGATAGAR